MQAAMTLGAVSMMMQSWRLRSDEPSCVEPGCQLTADAGCIVEQQFETKAPDDINVATEPGSILNMIGDSELESVNLSLADSLGEELAAETLLSWAEVNGFDASVGLEESALDSSWVATVELWCTVCVGILGSGRYAAWQSCIVGIRASIPLQYPLCFFLAAVFALTVRARTVRRGFIKGVSPTTEARLDAQAHPCSQSTACARNFEHSSRTEQEHLREQLAISQRRVSELEQRCQAHEKDAEIQALKLERTEMKLQQRKELLQQTAGELAELGQWAQENEAQIHALRSASLAEAAEQVSEGLLQSCDDGATLVQASELMETQNGIARIEAKLEAVLAAYASTKGQVPSVVPKLALEHLMSSGSLSKSVSAESFDSDSDVGHVNDKLDTDRRVPVINMNSAESDEETHAPTNTRSPRHFPSSSKVASCSSAPAINLGPIAGTPVAARWTPMDSDTLRDTSLFVSDAEVEVCNGDYVFECMHGSRPLFKSETGAVIFYCAFARCWKMCSADSTSSWHYCAGAPEDVLPPSGRWNARGAQNCDAKHSAPMVTVASGAPAAKCGWPSIAIVESPYGNN